MQASALLDLSFFYGPSMAMSFGTKLAMIIIHTSLQCGSLHTL